jgi:hypothetical protein
MDSPATVTNIAMGLLMGIGLIECFFGYRLFRLFLGITGFVVGAVSAGLLAAQIIDNFVVILVAGLIGALLGAGLMVLLFQVGLFIVGALLGILLQAVILSALQAQVPGWAWIVPALAGGALALLWQRVMIVLATSFEGAAHIVYAGVYLFLGPGGIPGPDQDIPRKGLRLFAIILAWLVLGFIGVRVQSRFISRHRAAAQREPIP